MSGANSGRAIEGFAFAFSAFSALAGWALFGGGFAFAAVCSGGLFAADVLILRLIVSAFTGRGGRGKISAVRAGVLFVMKIAVFAGIAVFLISVASLDIIGFTTGLTAGVAGVITAGLIKNSGTF
ncbi:MAG: hypothetical protein GKS04_00100 [Candidatus Mycalebacterium zealandia]|nr:MAG: hypothetical protein GKS04_00100 [Candidatus Mycalebacterium zealandia]